MKLILLPGFDGTGNFFANFVRRLPPSISYQVIPFPADKPLGYEELALLVIQALPGEDFVLLGESFSGPLCIKVAQAGSSHLKGIILVASFATRPLPKAMSVVAGPILRMAGKIDLPASFINSLLLNGRDEIMACDIQKTVQSIRTDIFLKRAAEALNVNVSRALEDIAVPVLILQATHDRLLRSSTSPELAKGCRQSTLHAIQGPHFLLQQSPEGAAFAVCEFIGKIEGNGEN